MRIRVVYVILFCFILLMQWNGANSDLEKSEVSGESDKIEDIVDIIDIDSDHGGFFIKNEGQWQNGFSYIFQTEGGAIGFRENGISINNIVSTGTWIIRDDSGVENGNDFVEGVVVEQVFKHNNDPSIEGIDPLPFSYNYFLGDDPKCWRSDVELYRGLYYHNVWDGIDLKYYLFENQLKYDFIVHPGADPEQIQLHIEGQRSLTVDEDIVTMDLDGINSLFDSHLEVFYTEDNSPINALFRSTGENSYGFEISSYDPDREIVIDPLIHSTFLGSSDVDTGEAMDVDTDGNILVVGSTQSVNFPVVSGSYNITKSVGKDIFISKLNETAGSLIFSTFVGGDNSDVGIDIEIGSNGTYFISGHTSSTNFPTTNGSFDRSIGTGWDVIAFSLNSTGGSLNYSTYIGGNGNELCYGMDIDPSDNIYLTGYTYSTDFPVSTTTYQSSNAGQCDIFITIVNKSGGRLDYSTYVGGSSYDIGKDIIIQDNKYIYLVGDTRSTNFPTTTGAYSSSWTSWYDIVALKIQSGGTSLAYSTYIGGGAGDYANAMYVSENGEIFLTGYTDSTNYPTTSNAYRRKYSLSNEQIILTQINPTGSTLNYSIKMGGSDHDHAHGIGLDGNGNVYLAGITSSTNFPAIRGSYDNFQNGNKDAYVLRWNITNEYVQYSSYFGGNLDDGFFGFHMGDQGKVYLIGYTKSTGFPTSSGAYDTSHNNNEDVVVSLVDTRIYPLEPRGLDYEVGNGYVQLNWTEPFYDGDDKISEYRIYRGILQGSETLYSTISGSILGYNDTQFINGQSYYYYLIAANSLGESLKSNTIFASDFSPPSFVSDDSDLVADTGEVFNFSFNLTDNVEVSEAFIEYWYGTDIHHNESIGFFQMNTWNHTISVEHRLDKLNYRVTAVDPTNNWYNGTTITVDVFDRSKPLFLTDSYQTSAFTGDPYLFSAKVIDNIDVEQLWVEYWYDGNPHENISMDYVDNNTWEKSIVISNTLETLNYTFHASDSSGNWNVNSVREIILVDNDKPFIIEDNTENITTTGEVLNVSIRVDDNIQVETIWIEYWYGEGEKLNRSMIRTSITEWHFNIAILDLLETLHYVVHVMDTSENWKDSEQQVVTVMDNDRPVFGADRTPSSGTTGDDFTFMINAYDNIGVDQVCVEYWYYDWEKFNRTMDLDFNYTLDIVIPSYIRPNLHYIYRVSDSSGNWANTTVITVQVYDDDLPIFVSDNSEITGYTGDDFVVEVEVKDNRQIDEVYIEYWFGENDHINISLDGYGPFNNSIGIPLNSILDLNYIFHFNDTSGNWNQTKLKNITVIDNDIPVFIKDLTPDNTTTGDKFNVSVEVMDNIELDGVWVAYWYGVYGVRVEVQMVFDGDQYYHTLSVQLNSLEKLYYEIIANDTSDLTNSTEMRTVEVLDDISPEIHPVADIVTYVGLQLDLIVNATDNIEITSIVWEDAPIESQGLTLSGIPEVSGKHTVTLTVLDLAGNSADVTFSLTILPDDYDGDEDGIPDLIEMANGLDINSIDDASLDPDLDGLTNLEEYLNNTDINDEDTDDDGMPDGWEVENDLDPLKSSAENDADGDGKSDLQEYKDGTDPNVKEFNPVILIVVFLLMVILISIVIVFFVIRSRKKGDETTEMSSEDGTGETVEEIDEQVDSDEQLIIGNEEPTFAGYEDNDFKDQISNPEGVTFADEQIPSEQPDQPIEPPSEKILDNDEGIPSEEITHPIQEQEAPCSRNRAKRQI